MLNRTQLHALAEHGVRRELAAIEQQLAVWHREFPTLFISNERPLLLKAELREVNKSNGLPKATERERRSRGAKKAWTPKRRKQAARQMKHQQPKLRAARKRADRKAGKQPWKALWYARLQAHGPEAVGASATALSTTSAILITSSDGWLKAGYIKKTAPGVYAVGKALPAAEA